MMKRVAPGYVVRRVGGEVLLRPRLGLLAGDVQVEEVASRRQEQREGVAVSFGCNDVG